jgi:hypothetical protein
MTKETVAAPPPARNMLGGFRTRRLSGSTSEMVRTRIGSLRRLAWLRGAGLPMTNLRARPLLSEKSAREEGTECGPLRGCAYAVVVN